MRRLTLLSALLPTLLYGARLASAQEWPCQPHLPDAEVEADDDASAELADDGAIALRIRPVNPLSAIPMAVPDPLIVGDADPDRSDARLARTLRRDLELAGYFDLLMPAGYHFDPGDEPMNEVQFRRWSQVGAQGLVKTAIRRVGDQVWLDMRLFDIDRGERIALDLPIVETAPRGVEAAVHRFAALVVEHYSGCRAPFGTDITFVGRSDDGSMEIYRMAMGDEEPVRVTQHRDISNFPEWAGSEIVYTTYVNGNPDLTATDGTTTRVISDRPGYNVGGGLSPDGSELLAALTFDGNSEIYLLDPSDGAIRARLTENRAEDTSPTWSPSGRHIAFESDRSGTPQVYVMNRDGSDQHRLTFEGSYNTTPSFSPDGTRIAFTSRNGRNRLNVMVVDVASSQVEPVTQDQGNNEAPSWSPDGRYLVFSSDRGGGTRLWIATEDGNFQTPLTIDGTGYTNPAWHP